MDHFDGEMMMYDMQKENNADVEQRTFEIGSNLLEKIKDRDKEDVFEYIRENVTENIQCVLFPEIDERDYYTYHKVNDKLHEIRKQLLPAACRRGDKDIVSLLFHLNADPYLGGDQGTPLEIATIEGNAEIIDLLVAFEEDLLRNEQQLQSCLRYACRWGHTQLVDYWINHLKINIHPNTFYDLEFRDGYHPVCAAREGGHGEVIKKLLTEWVEDESRESYRDQSQNAASESGHIRKEANWSKRNLIIVVPEYLRLHNPRDVLTSIDLSDNEDLCDIPGDLLWGLPTLETLRLSRCKLSEIPAIQPDHDIDNLRLHSLYLSGNKLYEIRMEIFMIPSLTHLELQHNSMLTIDGISSTLSLDSQTDTEDIKWRCANLEHLNMEHNRLDKIPPGIKGASRLQTLKVNNNHLESLPPSWICPLKSLHAQHNCLSLLPELSDWRRTLNTLDISANKFSHFPLSACKLFALENLNLSYNRIWKLPDVRDWYTYRLRVLNLSNNQLMFFSSEVKEMLVKETVETDRRREWRQLTGGSYVPLWLRDITPDKLAAHNTLPVGVASRLNSLDLSNNRIQALPESICEMTKLQMLHINGNCSITCLPDKLGLLRDLFVLDLTDLDIREPKEVVQILREREGQRVNTATTVVNALKERFLKYQPYRGVKLMVIGPHRSGKTKMLTRLLDSQYLDSDSSNTHIDAQVQLQTWRGTTPRRFLMAGDSIDFTIWDVKGGVDSALIGQSLFTRNTIYVLVWNAKYNKDKSLISEIRKWILNVKLLAPGSRIIAVGSHLDILQKPGQETTLRHILANEEHLLQLIADEVLIDSYNKNGRGIKKLSQKIVEYALTMRSDILHGSCVPLIGRRVPTTFIDMKEQLKQDLTRQQNSHNNEPRIITGEEFKRYLKDIDKEGHIVQSGELSQLVCFLHETGSLIHVSDHTYGLTNLYFLDPNWLCQVLLDAEMVQPALDSLTHCRQKVPKDVLKTQCIRSGFGETRFAEYLELLGRFEIAIKTSEDSYILPALLPENKPLIVGNRAGASIRFHHKLLRLYKLSFVPPGFFSRLISRILAETQQEVNGRRVNKLGESITTPWQHGISIQTDTQRIDVELKPHESEHEVSVMYIYISVQSADKDHMARGIGFVVDHIDYLIKEWYPEIEMSRNSSAVQRLVPCPSCVSLVHENNRNITDVATVSKSFTDLTIAAIKNETMDCEGHTINPRDVAPDLFLLDLGVEVLDGSKLSLIKKLGVGGFGVVYQACLPSGEFLALKSLLKSAFDGKAAAVDWSEEMSDCVILKFPDFRREIAVMSRLRHPCILQLKSVSIQKLWFAMEFAPLGDLAGYIDNQLDDRVSEMSSNLIHGTFLERMLTFKIAYQIVTAVEYLHWQGIIHTDLKTDNILLFSTKPEDYVNVRLADYGISQSVSTGNVRGQAGTHAFVAPEIIDGKAFNEQVDIFSVGMILYHSMSGVPPGGHGICIKTTLDIASGARPTFEFQGYILRPHFQHLETTMKSCWETNPKDRPPATDILDRMKKPGFSCLAQSVTLDNVTDPYLSLTHEQSGLVYIWVTGKRERETGRSGRVLCKVNLETSKKTFYENPVDSKVLSAYHCDEFLFIGTKTEGIRVFKQTPIGFKLTVLKQSVELGFPVSSLLYVPSVQQTDQDIANFLYVGLQDGRIAIYEYIDDDESWSLPTFCFMSASALPCSCMLHLKKDNGRSDKLIVGCGNTIRTVNMRDHTVDGNTTCIPDSSSDQHVVGLVSFGGHIWCHLSHSSRVYQFNDTTGLPTSLLECRMKSFPIRGVSLLVHGSKRSTLVAHSQSVSLEMDVPVARNRTQTEQRVQITCLLPVKDTLWIGRSTGDILIVDIGITGDFGQLKAWLQVDPILGLLVGPVKSLLNPTPCQVIACREVVQAKDTSEYQILVWNDWGNKEADEFEHALLVQ